MRLVVLLCIAFALSAPAVAQNPLAHWTDGMDLRSARSHPVIDYTIRIDSTDLTGWGVTMRARNLPAKFTLAMARHPEYDERYWRFVRSLDVAGGSVARRDSAVWDVSGVRDSVTIRYRIQIADQESFRGAWRPYLMRTGGLVGGIDAFMYVVGAELAPSHVRVEAPPSWKVATGLARTTAPNVFFARSVDDLIESPMLVGLFSDWSFDVQGTPHRVVYLPLPASVPFDSARFVDGLGRLTRESIALFGRAPYRDYTFMFQDGAYGGLEHPSSVTQGVSSTDLAKDPNTFLQEAAHEFIHTWNLMRIRPVEYRGADYRPMTPSAGLWFSEGLTIYYADALLRRAGIPLPSATRAAHLSNLFARYLDSPGAQRFSAETVSRAAYNSGPLALGDYTASSHTQGELIGTVLDFVVRDATDGAKTMDDVMRLMLDRFSGKVGFTSRDVERTVADVCKCSVRAFFNAHVYNGAPIDIAKYAKLAGFDVQVEKAMVARDGVRQPDLSMTGWNREGEKALSLRIMNPNGIWRRAGLHTGDRIMSMNGSAVSTWPELRNILRALKLGDSVRVVVSRDGGPFTTTVKVAGYEQARVTLTPLASATAKAMRIRERWLTGW